MKNVGRGNVQDFDSRTPFGKDNRPQLWPAVLLKSINKRRDPRNKDPLVDDFERKKKKVAESLVAAKVRGRRVGNGIRRRVRVGVMRVRETVKHVQSAMENSAGESNAATNGVSSSGGEDSTSDGNNNNNNNGSFDPPPPTGASSSNSDSDDKAPTSESSTSTANGTHMNGNGTGSVKVSPEMNNGNSSTAPLGGSGVSTWPGIWDAYEKLKEVQNSMVIPPFIKEFNEQMKGGFPNKRRLDIVQEFFKYTEFEGRRFFDELDRDKDGVITLGDMKAEMKRRNLPEKYANNFIKRAKRHAKWPFGNSINWEDFKSLSMERESSMLNAFNSLEVSQFGSLKKHQIKSLLQKMQFRASDDNAESMLKYLDADASGYVSYGKYRNFLLLIPKDRIREKDIGLMWFDSATMVPMILPPGNQSKRMLIISTLASSVISGVSTLALHPLDTLKTRLQASSGGSILSVFRSVGEIGRRGLYRGVIPATAGAASSQGFRVGVFEAMKLGTKVLVPSIPDLQVQTIASGMGSLIGTVVRIPCEVLKQRLQAGQYPGVWTAISTVMKKDGPRGLFRGSTATLSREIPFYVIGMVAYEQFKKAALAHSREKRGRDLEAWETIALGALSGAVAAFLTTPFDVLKTRLMTGAVGAKALSINDLAAKIVKEEGPGALFKGALPRALWIAPLGAMNFAGYELAKNAISE
jgi:Ca2+-binding EF-hand superfamily protein